MSIHRCRGDFASIKAKLVLYLISRERFGNVLGKSDRTRKNGFARII